MYLCRFVCLFVCLFVMTRVSAIIHKPVLELSIGTMGTTDYSFEHEL